MSEKQPNQPDKDEIMKAPSLDFDVLDPERWIRIKTADGTELKVKTDVVGVKRLLRKTPDGHFAYVVQTHTFVRVSFEDPLKFNK